jgi:hypothetical protein
MVVVDPTLTFPADVEAIDATPSSSISVDTVSLDLSSNIDRSSTSDTKLSTSIIDSAGAALDLGRVAELNAGDPPVASLGIPELALQVCACCCAMATALVAA